MSIGEKLQIRLEKVTAERDALGRLVHRKSVALQRTEAERDALAAHVERLNSAIIDWNARGVVPDDIDLIIDETPDESLSRRDLLKQSEALREMARDLLPVELDEMCEVRQRIRDKALCLRQKSMGGG